MSPTLTFTARAARRTLIDSGLHPRDAYDLLADHGHDPAAPHAPAISLEALIRLVAEHGPFLLLPLNPQPSTPHDPHHP